MPRIYNVSNEPFLFVYSGVQITLLPSTGTWAWKEVPYRKVKDIDGTIRDICKMVLTKVSDETGEQLNFMDMDDGMFDHFQRELKGKRKDDYKTDAEIGPILQKQLNAKLIDHNKRLAELDKEYEARRAKLEAELAKPVKKS